MIDEWERKKGSGRSLIDVLFWHLPKGTEENHI
jgi:hypothetical protein